MVYVPVVPAVVTFESKIVGLGTVLYTTPLSVIAEPPSEVTFPPDLATEAPIKSTAVVAAKVGAIIATGTK
ncbi:MAG: hypothetical protein IPO23_12415 [Flavobacterium sp.]|nr:hypothetical protein [Flavobacterium sp.]